MKGEKIAVITGAGKGIRTAIDTGLSKMDYETVQWLLSLSSGRLCKRSWNRNLF